MGSFAMVILFNFFLLVVSPASFFGHCNTCHDIESVNHCHGDSTASVAVAAAVAAAGATGAGLFRLIACINSKVLDCVLKM